VKDLTNIIDSSSEGHRTQNDNKYLSMSKYQKYFQDMLDQHKELFDGFKKLHDAYVEDEKKWQKEFNEKGMDVLDVIRRYENMLCNQSEGGKYGKFSAKLSEKFWEPIRAHFPKIDFIGME